ncbi:arylsulfatase [Algoriphagus sp. AK58]|uniref:arylsulfatase n=1 Tax=Algoriphagus sp. AK58 TaxID=1406877 RepID=UPI00164FA460|nr:arylsulfatase [Algoriphagus sp. AK58]MBC6367411.1 sulfatase [Algoriphagus sp. AK58]
MKNRSFVLSCFVMGLILALFGCKQEATQDQNSDSKKPNILIIVADDMGFSDIASFGGNIETPFLTGLAKEGISFSNFYVQPTCSPTRASLLTGTDNHVAGLGIMSEMDYPVLKALRLPGYSGHLSKEVVTIPEILRGNGYHTYMTGKWHLGEGKGMDPFDRGFEETFILGTGGGSHWNDKKALSLLQHMEYTRNGVAVEPAPNFYSTTSYTDSLLSFISKHKADQKPFFAYLSYTAVHDPLHAPDEYIQKYKGKFDMGWDSLWVQRMENLKSLGMLPKDLKGSPSSPFVPRWESLSAEQKEEYARDMEVYAGMLDYLDTSIGRVFAYLKENGMYDNTLVVFMSDNGANGANARSYPGNEDGKYPGSFDNSLENRGKKGSYVEMGSGWAQASSSPFRYFKSFTSEGGIKVPLIIKMPGQMKQAGQWDKTFVHVTDIMPTLLELTGSTYPSEYNGNVIHPHIGRSILPLLNGNPGAMTPSNGHGWELFEMRAFIKGNWKILRLPQPMGSGAWELYDLEKDPMESTDLSGQFPEVKDELIKAWMDYAKNNAVHDHKGHYDSLYRVNYSVPKAH